MKRFNFYFFFSLFFIILLVGEYLYCSANFRFIRQIDLWQTDLFCFILAIGLSFLAFKNLMKLALQEKIPFYLVLTFFLTIGFSFSFFLRFNLQILNGLLDHSEPEIQTVIVSGKNSSTLGGSIKDGMNPTAYYIYFPYWNDKTEPCSLLVPYNLYYLITPGTNMNLIVRKGFFHLPWVDDYSMVNP